jgi:hypothetical protein
MNGSGYIYFWRVQDGNGRIRVCQGDFAGLNVAFALADCDAALQADLALKGINQPRQCPPPDNALLVSFGFAIREGDVVAVNVSKSN